MIVIAILVAAVLFYDMASNAVSGKNYLLQTSWMDFDHAYKTSWVISVVGVFLAWILVRGLGRSKR